MGVGAGLYMCDVVKKVHVRYLISWGVLVLVTSSARAVAKYCDEYMSLCVCLSARISPEPHARLPIFCACCLWQWLGPPPAEWRNPNWKWQFWEFFSPVTMCCNAFAAKDYSISFGRGWWECISWAKCDVRHTTPQRTLHNSFFTLNSLSVHTRYCFLWVSNRICFSFNSRTNYIQHCV